MIEQLEKNGLLIGEHSTSLDFPIQYALVERDGIFSIHIYHEQFCDGARSANSDVPFAIWHPDKKLQCFNTQPFVTLRAANLLAPIEEFCEEAYAVWKEEQDAG